MNEETNRLLTNLLRLWRAQYQGQWQWRASLESPHTGERQSFTGQELCPTFLRELCNSQVANMPDPGKEFNHEKIKAE